MPSHSALESTDRRNTEQAAVLSNRPQKEKIMIKPRIIVTGATGKAGSVVAAELLKAGGNAPNAVAPKPLNQARLRGTGLDLSLDF